MMESTRPNIDPSTFLNLSKGSNAGQKSETYDVSKFLDTRLADGEDKKKVRIRLLPFTPGGRDLFFKVEKHSVKLPQSKFSATGWKNFICYDDPHNPSHEEGKKCPLCEKHDAFVKQAIEYARQKKEWINKLEHTDLGPKEAAQVQEKINELKALQKQANDSAFMYNKKDSYIVRVIDRAHEEDGPKFYTFNSNMKGEGVLDKMLAIYNERDEESLEATGNHYNVFDLYNGKDLTLHIQRDQNGHSVVTNITDGVQRPLSNDQKTVDAWVNDPTRWTDLYSFKSYEYLEIVADGQNPVFNKNDQRWEAWVDYSNSDKANAESQKAQEYAQQAQTNNIQSNQGNQGLPPQGNPFYPFK